MTGGDLGGDRLDFRNVNTLWASVAAETLARLGLQVAIVCPGSRSAPLAVAVAAHPDIEAIPVLDERSAAFFALGIAQQTARPVALVCTSGTAGANFYPAVIEATESRLPLLVLTADRPPELRQCQAGQAIDQVKLYGSYPKYYAELSLPSRDLSQLAYLRQTLVFAWRRASGPTPGVAHLNCPFREPLVPVVDAAMEGVADRFPADFFAAVTPAAQPDVPISYDPLAEGWQHWQRGDRGIIIAGVARALDPERYCGAIAALSQRLGFPVLAEGLSPVRNFAHLNPHLISTYDAILRHPQQAAELAPDIAIQIGDLPTSKELRHWLQTTDPRRWVLDGGDRNLDPLHGRTVALRTTVEQLVESGLTSTEPSFPSASQMAYLKRWQELDGQMRRSVDDLMEGMEAIAEPKIAWFLARHLPPDTALFVANSTPVRDVEWFWPPGNSRVRPFFNRGANGIDGTLSTALGVAHRNRATVLLCGDLALLHDTNGFLLARRSRVSLAVVLVNNNGGGIFQLLSISQFEPPFEDFFATPQGVDVAQLCRAYGVEHQAIETWEDLSQGLKDLDTPGVRLLEIRCDRQMDAAWRQRYWAQAATSPNFDNSAPDAEG